MKHFSIIIYLAFSAMLSFGKVQAQATINAPKNGTVFVIAHRGAHSSGIPENSLPAYQKAIDLGCDFVEIDVRTSKDGEIVSIHNETIEAYVAGATGKISEMTYAELKSMDIGIRFGEEWKNTKIPTFDEILELCRGKIGIYLDLKDADPSILIEKIRKYKMERQIVWYVPASRNKTIMKIKHDCPECLIMPDPGHERNIDKVVVAYQPKFIASDMDHLSKSFVEKAHKNKILVFVDDDEDDPSKWELEWAKIRGWGTDGIQTDQPEALITFLKRNR